MTEETEILSNKLVFTQVELYFIILIKQLTIRNKLKTVLNLNDENNKSKFIKINLIFVVVN